MKHKWICYGCGKAVGEGYHVLRDDTIYHYCSECLGDVKAVRRNKAIQVVEKFQDGMGIGTRKRFVLTRDWHTNEKINFPVEIAVYQDSELSIYLPSCTMKDGSDFRMGMAVDQGNVVVHIFDDPEIFEPEIIEFK